MFILLEIFINKKYLLLLTGSGHKQNPSQECQQCSNNNCQKMCNSRLNISPKNNENAPKAVQGVNFIGHEGERLKGLR